jgi:hypothetical protein
VRVLDLRDAAACAASRVPGAECVAADGLGALGLDADPGARDLVLVADGPAPRVRRAGRVLRLDGGFEAWRAFALTAPPPLPAAAGDAARAAWLERAGLVAALANVRTAPPPPPSGAAAAPRRKGGAGCGG